MVEVDHPQRQARRAPLRVGRVGGAGAKTLHGDPDKAREVERVEVVGRGVVPEAAVIHLEMVQAGGPIRECAIEPMPFGKAQRAPETQQDDAIAGLALEALERLDHRVRRAEAVDLDPRSRPSATGRRRSAGFATRWRTSSSCWYRA